MSRSRAGEGVLLHDVVNDRWIFATCDPLGNLYISAIIPGIVNADVTDRWARQLGQIDLARVLGAPLSAVNPVIAGLYDAAGNRMPSMDAVIRPGYVDVIDRAARLLGTVSPVAGSVWDVSDRWARQLGLVDLSRVLGAALSAANPVIAGLYDAAGNRMPSMDVTARAGFVDVIDRAARLLGVVYGSQAQQLLQRAATFDLLVQLRSAGAEVDPRDANYDITTVSNLIDEVDYTWNADGTCNTAIYKKSGGTVFTITYTWNPDKTLNMQVRT